MPIKYIGRTTSFRGKSLWEIVGNLKNFGIARMVVRSRFERYPEPSYMRIVKVEGMENEPSRKVCVWVEKVFRGNKLPDVTKILKTSYKTDYRLIPKEEEDDYIKGVGHKEHLSTSTYSMKRVLPLEMPLPPLLLIINLYHWLSCQSLCSNRQLHLGRRLEVGNNLKNSINGIGRAELNKAALWGKGKLDKVSHTIPLVVRQGPANRAVVVPGASLKETVLVEEPDAPRLYQGLK